jgi:YgiT-type zinc finger domain-containing protein
MDKCLYCGAELKQQKVNIARYWGKKLIALNDVPVLVCQKCGERFFEAKVSAKVDERIQQILSKKISSENINVPQVQY